MRIRLQETERATESRDVPSERTSARGSTADLTGRSDATAPAAVVPGPRDEATAAASRRRDAEDADRHDQRLPQPAPAREANGKSCCFAQVESSIFAPKAARSESTNAPSSTTDGVCLYRNPTGACASPGCDAEKSAGSCFVCNSRVCSTHLVRSHVVARLGAVEPVNLCCGCLNDRDTWRRDCSTQQCFDCSRRFFVFRRRHHCRVCGNVFCDACTKYRGTVSVSHPAPSQVKVRVCLPCSDSLGRGLRERAPTVLDSPHGAGSGPRVGRSMDCVFRIEEDDEVNSDVFVQYCKARDEFVSQSQGAGFLSRGARQRDITAAGNHIASSVASGSSDRE